jgi:charged multivesicular body protein 6
MGAYYSKSKKAAKEKQPPGEITNIDRSILNLKTQRRKLNDQRSRLEILNEKERGIVKELLEKKLRNRALLTLKKVKMQEGQMDQIDTYLLRVEELLVNIETSKETKMLFDTLRLGADALKSAQSQLSLEEVGQLAEDTADAKEYEQRLNQLMGESWTGELDDEVLQELERIEEAVFGEELPDVPNTHPLGNEEKSPAEAASLPDVPTHEIEPVDLLRAQSKATGGEVRAKEEPEPMLA